MRVLGTSICFVSTKNNCLYSNVESWFRNHSLKQSSTTLLVDIQIGKLKWFVDHVASIHPGELRKIRFRLWFHLNIMSNGGPLLILFWYLDPWQIRSEWSVSKREAQITLSLWLPRYQSAGSWISSTNPVSLGTVNIKASEWGRERVLIWVLTNSPERKTTNEEDAGRIFP